MKLYHGTKKENERSILENGLIPQESNKINADGVRLDGSFIYGFEDLQEAIDFMVYDNNTPVDEVIVFEFLSESPIKDIEYENGAFAHESTEPVFAKIVD